MLVDSVSNCSQATMSTLVYKRPFAHLYRPALSSKGLSTATAAAACYRTVAAGLPAASIPGVRSVWQWSLDQAEVCVGHQGAGL